MHYALKYLLICAVLITQHLFSYVILCAVPITVLILVLSASAAKQIIDHQWRAWSPTTQSTSMQIYHTCSVFNFILMHGNYMIADTVVCRAICLVMYTIFQHPRTLKRSHFTGCNSAWI